MSRLVEQCEVDAQWLDKIAERTDASDRVEFRPTALRQVASMLRRAAKALTDAEAVTP